MFSICDLFILCGLSCLCNAIYSFQIGLLKTNMAEELFCDYSSTIVCDLESTAGVENKIDIEVDEMVFNVKMDHSYSSNIFCDSQSIDEANTEKIEEAIIKEDEGEVEPDVLSIKEEPSEPLFYDYDEDSSRDDVEKKTTEEAGEVKIETVIKEEETGIISVKEEHFDSEDFDSEDFDSEDEFATIETDPLKLETDEDDAASLPQYNNPQPGAAKLIIQPGSAASVSFGHRNQNTWKDLEEEKRRCFVCEETFKSQSLLGEHYRSTRHLKNREAFILLKGEEKRRQREEENAKSMEKAIKYACDKCGFQTTQQAILTAHREFCKVGVTFSATFGHKKKEKEKFLLKMEGVINNEWKRIKGSKKCYSQYVTKDRYNQAVTRADHGYAGPRGGDHQYSGTGSSPRQIQFAESTLIHTLSPPGSRYSQCYQCLR